MPDNDYELWLKIKAQEWEASCRQCGACCGAGEDPCAQLGFDVSGQSFCRVYSQRFEGEQRTLSGQFFSCIPIRQKLRMTWPGDEKCAYR